MVPQVRPDGTESVRDTMPVNPLSPVTVIVETACCPTSVLAGDVAAIENVWPRCTLTLKMLWNVNWKKTKYAVAFWVKVNGVSVALRNTWTFAMSTFVLDMVTLANAVVPVAPLAVKLMLAAVKVGAVIVALLVTEHVVQPLTGVVAV
jgi:hypothetical protein